MYFYCIKPILLMDKPTKAMNRLKRFLLPSCLAFVTALSSGCGSGSVSVPSLPDYPVAGGVSAPFAGCLSNRLIVAGGCNFPGVPAAEGGRKAYYAETYGLSLTSSSPQWMPLASLPVPTAYGASIQVPQGIVCVGGQNERSSLSTAFLLQWDDDARQLLSSPLPSLPLTIDNAGGAYADGKVIVTGGNQTDRGQGVYALDLNRPEAWQKLCDYPGPCRVQPIVLAHASSLYLIGGFDARQQDGESTLSTNILRYDLTTREWAEEAQLPADGEGTPRCLVGGSGVCTDDCLILAGGVNYAIFKEAVEGKAPADYLKRPREWYKFNRDLLVYHLKDRRWSTHPIPDGTNKAGGILVHHRHYLYMVCGETKPGIRTQEVVAVPLQELFR